MSQINQCHTMIRRVAENINTSFTRKQSLTTQPNNTDLTFTQQTAAVACP